MIQEEEGAAAQTAGSLKSTSLVLAIVCAFLSAIFLNTGFLSFFFLAPLGYAVLVYGSLWIPFFVTAVINIACSLILRLMAGNSSGGLWIGISYFTVVFLCFAWITGGANFRTAYRFILASAAGALVFFIFIFADKSDSGFNAVLRDMAQIITSIVASAAGDDAVRNSLLRQMLTPEKMLEIIKAVLLRGGYLFSILFMFFINRQISAAIMWITKRQRKDRGLALFFAPDYTIWALSGSLAIILLTRTLKIEILEILAWNVFVICSILFLAQGAGIVLFMLARRTPVSRFAINVLIVIIIISPGLNTLAIAALLLLGIAENWLPLRAPKQGPASTPEP